MTCKKSALSLLMGVFAITTMVAMAKEPVFSACQEKDIVPAYGYLESENDTETDTDIIYEEELHMFGDSESASEDNTKCGDDAYWSIEDGVLTVSGTGAIYDYTLTGNSYGGASVDTPWASYSSSITSIDVKSGITAIGKAAFATLYNVTELSLPDTVTTLGEASFYGMSSLKEVSLPSAVKSLPSGLFADCRVLNKVTYGDITDMGSYAFQNVPLETAVIPATLTNIDGLAFFMSQVSSFVSDGNKQYTAVNGVLYTDGGESLYMYPSSSAAEQFTIPATVKTIKQYAFANTKNLKSVNFGNVTTLEDGAFYQSSLSGALVLPDSITTVGDFGFEKCMQITGVTFGNGLEETSYRMFEDCIGITSISFGGLKKLGMRTFKGCNGLTGITLPDTMTEWGGSVFNSCSNLVSFTANGLKAVSYADFAQCYSLTTVKLGSVENIYREAFNGCTKLTEITLPATTQFVNATAFPATTKITCLNKELVPFGQSGLHYAEPVEITGIRDYSKAFEVLKIVNGERQAQGLSALKMEQSMLESAMIRAAECSLLFSHTRPDSTLCMTANENMYAENIAMGQSTAEQVMASWMNSEGHKANILTAEFNSIGIGCFVIDGSYYWTQCFSIDEADADCAMPTATQNTALKANLPRDTFSEAPTTAGIIFGSSSKYTYQYSLSYEKDTLAVNDKVSAKVILENPGDQSLRALTIKNMTFSSSDSSIVSVDNNGVATAKKKGSATITVKGKYFTANTVINVSGSDETVEEKAKTVTVTKKSITAKKPVITSVKQNKKGRKVKVKYNKFKGATGYQIQYSTSKKFKKKTTITSKKTSVNTKKLKKGKRYYVRVRAYIKSGSKKYYSKWSKVKRTAKIK